MLKLNIYIAEETTEVRKLSRTNDCLPFIKLINYPSNNTTENVHLLNQSEYILAAIQSQTYSYLNSVCIRSYYTFSINTMHFRSNQYL